MVNKHFALVLIMVFVASILCASHAHAMGHLWGSGSSGGGSDPSNSTSTESPTEQGWAPDDTYGFEPAPSYPTDEPIGEPTGSAPEPLTVVLLGTAVAGLGVRQWRKRKRS